MIYDPTKHRRRSIRLQGYDYARAGAYFITICTRDRAHLFGNVVAGKMRLNDLGKIVRATWNHLPDHYQVELDAFVIMPNHVHGIVVIPRTMAGTHPDAGDPPDPVGAGLKPAPTGSGGPQRPRNAVPGGPQHPRHAIRNAAKTPRITRNRAWFQNVFRAAHQRISPYTRRARLATQLLRTHRSGRGGPTPNPAIHRQQPCALALRP